MHQTHSCARALGGCPQKDALQRPYGPIEARFLVAQLWWRNPWLAFDLATAWIYSGACLARLRADALRRKALKLAPMAWPDFAGVQTHQSLPINSQTSRLILPAVLMPHTLPQSWTPDRADALCESSILMQEFGSDAGAASIAATGLDTAFSDFYASCRQ